MAAAVVLAGACAGAEDRPAEETTTTTIPVVSEVGQRRPWDGLIVPPDPVEGYDGPTVSAALADLVDLGAPNAALVVALTQDDGTGNPVRDPAATPSDAELGDVMATADRLELGVVLQLRVEPSTGLLPAEPEPAARARWFRDYTRLAVHYAELAEEHGVDLLVLDGVSSELLAHDDPWIRLLGEVRGAYGGPVSLAVDAGHVDDVAFWDEVDLIGIDVASPPPADVEEPVAADYEKAWEPVLAELSRLAESWTRPVVVTRVGIPSVSSTDPEPPEGEADGQQAGYEALFTVMNQTPAVEGVLVWRWGGEPVTANGSEATYSPEDRPAEEVLRRAWTTPLADESESESEPDASADRDQRPSPGPSVAARS